MDAAGLVRYCDGHGTWLREQIETFVRLESPSTDKFAVDRC